MVYQKVKMNISTIYGCFRTTNCYGLSTVNGKVHIGFLSFRTTNCYGLSITVESIRNWLSIVSVQRIVMVYQYMYHICFSGFTVSVQRIVMVYLVQFAIIELEVRVSVQRIVMVYRTSRRNVI